MGGDQLCVTQPQGLEDVFLLTEEVLLVVAVHGVSVRGVGA